MRVQDTEERLRTAEARAGRYGRKLEGAHRRVGMLKQAIQDMFAQAGCDTPATRGMLGDGGVSETNLMVYLGIIEQRTNEILQVGLPVKFSHALTPPPPLPPPPPPLPPPSHTHARADAAVVAGCTVALSCQHQLHYLPGHH